MVEISDLQVGMRVKVVDEWPPDGICYQVFEMDRLLGGIVTVRYISDDLDYVSIEEDRRWAWNKYCFDYIVEEEIEPPNMGDILSLFGGDAYG